MMQDHPQFMNQFRGYLEWDNDLKAQALELVLKAYIQDYGLITDATEFIETVEQFIMEDIEDYLEREEYEICTLLRDLLEYL